MVLSESTIPAIADIQFDLEYDGPALSEHEMDVRDLAPALISAAELFQELNRLLYPLNPPVSVNVKAHSEGSFLVQLKIVLDHIQSGLLSDTSLAITQLAALIAIPGALIRYIVMRRKSPVVSQTPTPNGNIVIEFANGTRLEIPPEVLQAAGNLTVRQRIAEVTKPLRDNAGIRTFRLRQEEIVIASADREEAHVLEEDASSPAPAGDVEVLSSNERDVQVVVLNAALQPGNKWRVSDGISQFFATIEDEGFNDRLARHLERFGMDDRLRVRLRQVQYADEDGAIHVDSTIVRVHEIILAPARPPDPQLDLGDAEAS